MDGEACLRSLNGHEGRPYRSHLQPACIPCRTRKSRCKTRISSSTCVMCQAHGTECIFPPLGERSRKARSQSKRVSTPRTAQPLLSPTSTASSSRTYQPCSTTHIEPYIDGVDARSDHSDEPSPSIGQLDATTNPALAEFISKTEQGSSHVVSLAIAEDDKVFQEYLSNTPYGQSRRMVRFHLDSNGPNGITRPIVFNTQPKRGAREVESRGKATKRLELVEKTLQPHLNDLIDL